MKRVVVICIMFFLPLLFVPAQTGVQDELQNESPIELKGVAYNELGSNGLVVRLRKAADAKMGTGFGGFYNTIYAKLTYGKVGSEIKYTLRFEDFDNLEKYTMENSTMDKASVWVKPLDWLQIVMGPNYAQALPGSFLVVYDDYTQNGLYGTRYFGASVLFDYVQAGFSIPSMVKENGDFDIKADFGINGTIPIGRWDLNIGASYKMTTESYGIYASFGSLEDTFYVGGGFTSKGKNIFLTNRFEAGFQDVVGDRFGFGDDSIITLSGMYNGPVTVGADMEIAYGENTYRGGKLDTLLYTGLLVSWDGLEYLDLKFTGSYGASILESKKSKGAWSLDLYPEVTFTIGKHAFTGGLEFNFYSTRRAAYEDPRITNGFALPLSWKYSF